MTQPDDRASGVRVDVHLDGGHDDSLARDVRAGLTATPKVLPPKWFYDDRGSDLFDQITRLPEYYPTEAERSILHDRAAEIAKRSEADTIVELGAGTCDKSRVMLDAFVETGRPLRFVPFDVSEATVRDAATRLAVEYPGIEMHAVVGDFDRHLGEIPTGGTRLIAFLGGTIGNFPPSQRAGFFAAMSAAMRPGDAFLLGTDLVKDPARIEAAYDDASGVTAEFNLNVLRVINRELDADFDIGAFTHEAYFDPVEEWLEMRLRADRAMDVHIAALDLTVTFAEGEFILTEISAKFRRDRVAAELAAVGLDLAEWWTDDAGEYALSLAIRG